jgi:hypothetical protein
MKRLIMLTALLAVVALPAAAYSLDDLKVSNHGSSCTRQSVPGGTALNCNISLSGLANNTATIQVSAPFMCTNRGGNQPPGQVSSTPLNVTPQNGNVNTTVTTSAASCPDQMTPTFGTQATLTVQQGGKTYVFLIPIS